MGETPSQIAEEIERTRAELGSNFQELGQKVKSATDWRRQFQNSPFFLMGLAFGAGLLLAKLVAANGGRR